LFDITTTSQRAKKNRKKVHNELDAFAGGRVQEHLLSEYEHLDDVSNEKHKLGDKTFFCVVRTLQSTEDGKIQVFSAILKPWLSPDFK
jgi:hypothetical protein